MAVSAPRAASRRGRSRRPDQLTGGRHGLTAEQVRASQRERILTAMTAATGAHGYHGVRVADVVWLAGVSRKTFYELFDGKDDCFGHAYGLWTGRMLAVTFEAFETQSDWVDQLRAGLTALLGFLAREPDAARLCLAEAIAVGGDTALRREAVMRELGRLFDPPDVPDGAIGAAVRTGRVSELVETLRSEIAAGRVASLPGLLPRLTGALVLPFRGVEAARRELERASDPPER